MTDRLAPRVRRWFVEHPFPTDVAFAVLIGAFTVLGLFSADVSGSEQGPDVIAIAIIVGQTVSFAFRRRAPLASLAGVTAFTVAFWIADYATRFDTVSILAVYAATAHGGPDRRQVWRVVGGVVATMTVIAIVGVLSPSEDLPTAAVFGIAAIHVTAAVAGEVVYDRRRRLAALERRAVRAEAERELLARQAVMDERARIARDLHDVVAHGMSVMVVQAGAAQRVVETDPQAAAAALEHIQDAGREALAQMRQMLEVLRDEHGEVASLTPQPNLDDLRSLARQCTESGLPTELDVAGTPPPGVLGEQMAAYRVVQEALTNSIKHAGRGARAAVRMRYEPELISVEVFDDGVGTTDAELARATGHGFVGMRERVDLYGGKLHYGPRPGGGFRVAARIPVAS